MEDIQNTESLETNNQVEGLFDDLVDEESMPTETETELEDNDDEKGLYDDEDDEFEEEVKQPSSKAKTTEPFLNIKYNKEEIGLTRDEARELAEKGKHLDKVRDELNGLTEVLDSLANKSNMTREQFIQHLVNTRNEVDLNEEVKALAQQYPDTPKELLEEHARLRLAKKKNDVDTKVANDQQKQVDVKREEIKRQIDIFKKNYPNVEPNKLDDEVYRLMDEEGYSLLEAYSIYKDKKTSSQLKSTQIKELNKRKSYGNITNMGENDKDDFMSGFNS